MPRSIRCSILVCSIFVVSTACKKAEAPAAPEGATPPVAAAAVVTQPAMCAESVTDCNGLSPCAPSPITAAQADIPAQPCTFQGEGGPKTQNFVDIYSWNLFLALNWPASTANCAADTTKSIVNVQSGDGTFVVWQTYMPAENVFLNPGYQKPAAWCSGNALAAGPNRTFGNEAKAVAAAKNLGGNFLKVAEPGGDVLQASGDVVTDQSQRWLRYEKLMNQTEYNYIVPDRWNAVQLQAMFDANQPITIPQGSIEIKSAWKVLTAAEISSNIYFTTTGTVCNTPDGQKTPCDEQPVTFGLVGLHLVQQTTDGGTMFWSTFEHKDNDTVFFNPNSTAAVNTDFATQPFTELDASCKGVNQPTQIKRVTPIPASTDLNAYYQGLLAGSVFANYQLISTQWTTGFGPSITHPNVANIVLETYVQSVSSGNATGCLACHLNATTNIKNAQGQFQPSNHSFLFLEAKFATMKPRTQYRFPRSLLSVVGSQFVGDPIVVRSQTTDPPTTDIRSPDTPRILRAVVVGESLAPATAPLRRSCGIASRHSRHSHSRMRRRSAATPRFLAKF